MEVWKKDSSVGQGDNWKKYNNDFMKFGSVCTNPIMIIFFKQFQGISWDWSCTFKAVSKTSHQNHSPSFKTILSNAFIIAKCKIETNRRKREVTYDCG